MTTLGGASRVEQPEVDGVDDPSPVTSRGLSDRTLVLVTMAVTLPVLWMGYGTDIDVYDVLASGDSIRAGDYMPSRPPGVPVFEATVALLDPVGGHLLVNLATAAAGAAAIVGIARLVRTWGHANGDLVALAVLAVLVAGYFGINPPGFVAEVVAFAFGLAAASFFPVILLGIFWKRATREGAIAGMLVGLIFTVVTIGMLRAPQIFGAAAPVIPDFFGITAQGVGTIGMVLNFVVMAVVSLLTPPPPPDVQEMVERIRYAGEPAVGGAAVAIE